MKLGLLAFPAIGVSLGLVACSEDAATNPNVDSGALTPVEFSSSSDFLETDFPGVELSSSFMPGIELSSSSIVGPGFGISSSSFVWPGPVVSSSSVVIPGGSNPGNESGDDENDNEDSRTLDGSQILLKLAGTSATVENTTAVSKLQTKLQPLLARAPTM
jgi:hypothetical protein